MCTPLVLLRVVSLQYKEFSRRKLLSRGSLRMTAEADTSTWRAQQLQPICTDGDGGEVGGVGGVGGGVGVLVDRKVGR